ncbi:MAG: YSC84-related protein [Bacteriovoracales bacterium]
MRKSILCLIVLISSNLTFAQGDKNLIKSSLAAIADFKKKDPGMEKFFKSSRGYAVFPNVGKGAFIVGGINGQGVLFVGGVPVGYSELTAVTIGAQAGGQAYREIIFFENDETVENFKHGDLKFAAQTSAVAVTAGASSDANYKTGVAVFTMAIGGLMLEASIGGQGFSYKPIEGKK